MTLNARGGIAVGEVILYIPILIISAFLVLRHGIKRKAGWVFLVVLSLGEYKAKYPLDTIQTLYLVRIIGGIAHVIAEVQSNPSNTVVTMYTILESAGLSPLMMATLGFLSTVYVLSIRTSSLCSDLSRRCQSVSQTPDISKLNRGLHVMGILNSIALILTIVGGIDLGNAKDQSDVDSASKKRHIGVILFLVLFILIALIHGLLWSREKELMRHRRTVSSRKCSLLAG